MKKILNFIKNAFVIMVTCIAVAMMIFTIVSVTTFNRNDRDLFGYKAYIVNTDSMSASGIHAGDLVLTKEVDPSTLVEGDIISYISQNSESFGQTITHKIRKLTKDSKGDNGFITYGTTTDTDDETVVTYPYVLGKYSMKISNIGNFFNFLKTTQGYIVCIFIPFMLLILYQGINSVRLFMRYKKEQSEQLETEKAQLQAEREENAKMMEELKLLKAQLESQTALKEEEISE